jgi:hypothetical protein
MTKQKCGAMELTGSPSFLKQPRAPDKQLIYCFSLLPPPTLEA